MPAPKQPNTTAAIAESARVRARVKHDRWAAEMTAAGWTCLPPPKDNKADRERAVNRDERET